MSVSAQEVPTRLKTFESQIHSRYQIDSFGGIAEYTVIQPEILKPGALPILIAGGWGEGIASLQDSARVVCEGGHEVILVDHTKDLGNPTEYPNIWLPSVTVQNANTINKILSNEGISRAHVIAHSRGGLEATLAALQEPERFKSIIFANSAGLIGEDKFLPMAVRFGRNIGRYATKDFENPRANSRLIAGALKYLATNPRRTWQEFNTVADITIASSLADLRQAGIKVGVIQAPADHGFPVKRVEQQVDAFTDNNNADIYTRTASNAGHEDIVIKASDSRGTMRTALEMINRFERSELDGE